MNDRDCDNCAHHSEGGCSVWECSFEQKEDDTISRLEATKTALEFIVEYLGGAFDENFQKKMIERMNALPSAQPDHWVPCSETIDIPDHEVLCCDRHGEELIGWLSYIDDQWLCESDGEMMYDTVARREKPEPYREEGGE